MKNKKGYTLTEILIVLSILGIVGGIATISYRGYNESVQKKDLKLHGELFANMVKNCVQGFGGWQPKTNVFPCKATTKAQLKDKLGFDCPQKATCRVYTNTTKPYYCLSIRKTVSGKKLQVLSRIPYNNPTNYQLWCGQVTAYLVGPEQILFC